MEQLHLDKIVEQIDCSFGDELPVTAGGWSEQEQEIVTRLLGEDAYQAHIQDLVNRQIIRDFLVNAVMLGYISPENLGLLTCQAGTPEGRSSLSLHMLMTSIEAADSLPAQMAPGGLSTLRPAPGAPPHMVIVGS